MGIRLTWCVFPIALCALCAGTTSCGADDDDCFSGCRTADDRAACAAACDGVADTGGDAAAIDVSDAGGDDDTVDDGDERGDSRDEADSDVSVETDSRPDGDAPVEIPAEIEIASCEELVGCMGSDPDPASCTARSMAELAAPAQQVLDCVDRACPDALDSGFRGVVIDCALNHCASELEQCTAATPQPADCGAVAVCHEACDDADTACRDACLASTDSELTRALVRGYSACADECASRFDQTFECLIRECEGHDEACWGLDDPTWQCAADADCLVACELDEGCVDACTVSMTEQRSRDTAFALYDCAVEQGCLTDPTGPFSDCILNLCSDIYLHCYRQ